mmetsp:Transcript_15784/g.38335  ORF Transcript_15784/g.38335 Transcript_15784/m.38335 type:complete len:259 (+) Transcript_15784:7170-7946(+)
MRWIESRRPWIFGLPSTSSDSTAGSASSTAPRWPRSSGLFDTSSVEMPLADATAAARSPVRRLSCNATVWRCWPRAGMSPVRLLRPSRTAPTPEPELEPSTRHAGIDPTRRLPLRSTSPRRTEHAATGTTPATRCSPQDRKLCLGARGDVRASDNDAGTDSSRLAQKRSSTCVALETPAAHAVCAAPRADEHSADLSRVRSSSSKSKRSECDARGTTVPHAAPTLLIAPPQTALHGSEARATAAHWADADEVVEHSAL